MITLEELLYQATGDVALIRCILEVYARDPITDQQWQVLFLRLGLDRDGQRRSLEETAGLLGISPEEAQQLSHIVLRRKPALLRKPLKELLG